MIESSKTQNLTITCSFSLTDQVFVFFFCVWFIMITVAVVAVAAVIVLQFILLAYFSFFLFLWNVFAMYLFWSHFCTVSVNLFCIATNLFVHLPFSQMMWWMNKISITNAISTVKWFSWIITQWTFHLATTPMASILIIFGGNVKIFWCTITFIVGMISHYIRNRWKSKFVHHMHCTQITQIIRVLKCFVYICTIQLDTIDYTLRTHKYFSNVIV